MGCVQKLDWKGGLCESVTHEDSPNLLLKFQSDFRQIDLVSWTNNSSKLKKYV